MLNLHVAYYEISLIEPYTPRVLQKYTVSELKYIY